VNETFKVICGGCDEKKFISRARLDGF
jgi:hypothetical protein